MRRLIALLLLLAAVPVRAETPVAGPHLSAEAVRTLAGPSAPAWRLSYRQDEGGAQSAVELTLAGDWLAVRRPGGTQLTDFRLRRKIYIPAAGTSFVSTSLYADIVFRIHELANRHTMGAALTAAKVALPPALAPTWTEHSLSIIHPTRPAPAPRRDGNSFLHGDVVLTQWQDGPVAPPAIAAKLTRLWRHAMPLHPAAAEALAATGRAPQRLEIAVGEVGAPHRRVLELEKAEWLDAAPYPLPAGAQAADPVPADPALRDLFALSRAAVAAAARPPVEDEYLRRIETSMARGAGLEAALWGMEMMLAFPGPISAICQGKADPQPRCAAMQRAMAAAAADARTAQAMGPGPLPRNRPTVRFDGLSSAHVGALLQATRQVMGGEMGVEQEAAYVSALRVSPGVANFYKDIGDMYQRGFRHPVAWTFYDLGRLLPGHSPGDMLGEVDRLEARLRNDFPQLF